MYSAYALTLTDYVVVGAAIMIAMFLLHKVLRLFGVNREAATGYALILPWMLGFLIWNLGPFIASLYLSFTEYTILAPPTWIGFDNYIEMFTDDRSFWRVLRFTIGYSV
ncbi:MAG: sugar ABC transporter permease, partial [Chloroflexia bacterium]|nr:sugar ABC transporter permease [Chloroflexia bacterium]